MKCFGRWIFNYWEPKSLFSTRTVRSTVSTPVPCGRRRGRRGTQRESCESQPLTVEQPMSLVTGRSMGLPYMPISWGGLGSQCRHIYSIHGASGFGRTKNNLPTSMSIFVGSLVRPSPTKHKAQLRPRASLRLRKVSPMTSGQMEFRSTSVELEVLLPPRTGWASCRCSFEPGCYSAGLWVLFRGTSVAAPRLASETVAAEGATPCLEGPGRVKG